MNEIKSVNVLPCPACGHLPKKWIEPARYRSSEIFCLACPKDPELMAQGKSHIVAVFNWNRSVYRWKEQKSRPKVWTWMGFLENTKIED